MSYLPGAGLPAAAPGVGAADAALPQAAGAGQALGLWEVLGLVWLLGAAALLIGALVAYLRVKGQVATAVKFAHNVYECGSPGSGSTCCATRAPTSSGGTTW